MINIKDSRKKELPETATIAIQGIEGSYSHLAANALFKEPVITNMRTFDGVFRAVDNGLCQYGILPIENSNAGSVTDVYELMKEYNFHIVRSAKEKISHALLQKTKTDISKIKEVYTHEQAARQCSKFFEQNPHIKLNIYEDTAAAARLIAESDRNDIAAIASIDCAELYNLAITARNIQNNDNNYTRFICISKKCEILDNANKISLMIALEHKPGALYEAIKQFAEAGLNLTKLESRPIADTVFEFMFYFDIDASVENNEVYNLLLQMEKNAKQFAFLGNYSEIEI